MKKERINEIWGVLFLLLGLFTLAGMIFFNPEDLPFYASDPSSPLQNVTGIIGAYLSFSLFLTFGLSAYLIPALFLLWSGCFFMQRVPERKIFKLVGLLIALFSTSTLITVSVPQELRFVQGGAVGYLAGSHLLRYFGRTGSYILAGSCLLLSLLLATDFLIYPLVKGLTQKLQANLHALSEKMALVAAWFTEKRQSGKEKTGTGKPLKTPARAVPNLPEIPLKVKQYRPDAETSEKEEPDTPLPAVRKTEVKRTEGPSESVPAQEGRFEGVIGSKLEGNYTFPSFDILKKPQKGVVQQEDLQQKSRLLEATLAEFGIEVKVVEVEEGPVITRYELLPAAGVKVNSIAALSDDIALALKAASVRLIIPIPGKSAVGVEVPNSVTTAVYFRELVESQAFRSKKYTLPLALGKDTSGKPLIADLTSMPHLLIAGTTGSGKTVCVNSLICGLLYSCSPEDLKLVMVDPKMVELVVYNKIPHMLTPVVTDVKKAAQTLNWVVAEMDNRYKLLATVGVRNIQAFNSRPLNEEDKKQVEEVQSENVIPARLPYIVIVIDELADLMVVAQDKVEGAITRLAQLSRAVGIHLVLATQRPSVDVITGVIKANFPARISFKVASKVDSRTVIDGNGADKLIGRGDMLFMQPGDAKPVRGQAALIVDDEINAIVKFVASQAQPEYHPEVLATQEGKSGAASVMDRDELFDEAVAIVLETGQASTSNLQRRLRLGYARAARIIDQMEAAGMIGPAQGAKPRDILIDRGAVQEEPVKQE